MNAHFAAVATALDDPELPVRVHASLALTELIIAHESGAYSQSFTIDRMLTLV